MKLAALMAENARLQERVAAQDAIPSQADKIAKETLARARKMARNFMKRFPD